jgi:hypothetical protein
VARGSDILKRGLIGTYHHASPQYLKRYAGECDFRYNQRAGPSVDDAMRPEKAIKGSEGKRPAYLRTDKADNA